MASSIPETSSSSRVFRACAAQAVMNEPTSDGLAAANPAPKRWSISATALSNQPATACAAFTSTGCMASPEGLNRPTSNARPDALRFTPTDFGDCTPGSFFDWAEGQHPVQRQADDDLRLPEWWPIAAAAVIAAVVLFSVARPWGFAQ